MFSAAGLSTDGGWCSLGLAFSIHSFKLAQSVRAGKQSGFCETGMLCRVRVHPQKKINRKTGRKKNRNFIKPDSLSYSVLLIGGAKPETYLFFSHGFISDYTITSTLVKGLCCCKNPISSINRHQSIHFSIGFVIYYNIFWFKNYGHLFFNRFISMNLWDAVSLKIQNYANHMPKGPVIRNKVISERYSAILFLDMLLSMV